MGKSKKRKNKERKLRQKFKKLEQQLKELFSSSSSSDDSSSSNISDSDFEENTVEIHDDIKSLLGADPNSLHKEGPDLHEEIITRWSAVIINGLEKDARQEILDKYPVPKNFLLLRAPKLNGELQSGIPATVLKQDVFLSRLQDQLASGSSALGIPFNQMVIQGDKENPILPFLVDVGELLTDIHHSMSLHRRYLLGSYLNPASKKVMDESPVGTYLFGEDLSEKFKAVAAMKRTGTLLVKSTRKPWQHSKQENLLKFKRSYHNAQLKPGAGQVSHPGPTQKRSSGHRSSYSRQKSTHQHRRP